MKKLPFILLLLPTLLWAKPVSMNQAQQVAEKFINSTDESLISPSATKPHRLKRVAEQDTDNPPYYIFNNEDGGFIIVAGNDCATPILGYSNEGYIDQNDMPIQLEELLNAYASEIQEAVDNNLQATNDVAASWETFNKAQQIKNTTVVNALITTSWNQYPRYNNKCPVDASLSSLGGHPTTGCVATAMAQIMKYWEYPKKGYGSKSYRSEYYGTLYADFGSTAYDWENMPSKLSSSTSSTQNNAVATLMYHCGVAVSMCYNSDGHGSSGAYVATLRSGQPSAEDALKTYFGYASTVSGKIWEQSISTSQWSNMLKSELDSKRPILYAGYMPNGNGGHAFICDGYDSNNKFHFNWGWGGQANGFFSLTALTPGNYNYSAGQQAVIGITPKDGSSPAKQYDLYMNTDLTATNTSSSSSSDPNAYYFGNTMSFTAKVENNGKGTFDGYLKVAAFTDDGDFVAWSNESYHFTLEAGKHTVQKTYTFTGGVPFLPGKYRAYMCYQDEDETESKLVKTDEGIFLTEYNNVAFTVKASSNLQIASHYTEYDHTFNGSYVTGERARMGVSIKNTSSSVFYGKIRLSLLNTDGSLAEVIEEIDYSKNGFPANSTSTDIFYNIIDVEPGTYNLTLQVKKSNQNSWSYMGCTTTYPNPLSVIVKAPTLRVDNFEPNDTESTATTLPWEINPEITDFEASYVTLHEDADVDFYKIVFPNANEFEVTVNLYDKYNRGGLYYENADAQFAYSIGGNTYSYYHKIKETITFNGPTILYFKVVPYGMSGLGYYELSGEINETANPNIQDVTCAQASQIASGLKHNTPTTETYNVTGYVTETDGVVSKGQQIFWMADAKDGGRVFQSYWCNVSEQIKVGDYVSVMGNILRYNSTYEIKHGDVLLLERKSTVALEDIHIDSDKPVKVLMDGHIYILRGDHVYDAEGKMVK